MVKATVLGIITREENGEMSLLLTKRSVPPYKDHWCLPGGHIEGNEIASDAAAREVLEETGVVFTPQFSGYFDEIIPDQSIHAVVLAFDGKASGTPKITNKNKEVLEIKWVPITEALTMSLAFEHNKVIKHYFNRLLKQKEEDNTGLFQELSYLRSEILSRFAERNKILHYTIILAGLFLGFGEEVGIRKEMLLLYPVLATFFAALWSHNDMRISHIGDYIKTNIEPKVKGLNWQNYLPTYYETAEPRLFYRKLQEHSVLGIFLITYILAIILALSPIRKFEWADDPLTVLLFILSIIAFMVTILFIRKRRKNY